MTRPDYREGSEILWMLILAAWLVSIAATFGALFIGEVMGQTPCLFCWYKRAFMFPLAVILAVGCYQGDGRVWMYGLPLSVIGLGIAAYHSLLYAGIIPESILPCGQGPSCASSDMAIFLSLSLSLSLSLPLLSAAAFLAITVILLLVRRKSTS